MMLDLASPPDLLVAKVRRRSTVSKVCQTGGEFTRIPLVVKQVETSVGKEWQVAYHGTTFDSVKDILVNGYDKDANPNPLYKPKKEKYGIYTSPNLELCTNILYAEIFEYNNRHYQIVLENQVSMDKTTDHKMFTKLPTRKISRSRQY